MVLGNEKTTEIWKVLFTLCAHEASFGERTLDIRLTDAAKAFIASKGMKKPLVKIFEEEFKVEDIYVPMKKVKLMEDEGLEAGYVRVGVIEGVTIDVQKELAEKLEKEASPITINVSGLFKKSLYIGE